VDILALPVEVSELFKTDVPVPVVPFTPPVLPPVVVLNTLPPPVVALLPPPPVVVLNKVLVTYVGVPPEVFEGGVVFKLVLPKVVVVVVPPLPAAALTEGIVKSFTTVCPLPVAVTVKVVAVVFATVGIPEITPVVAFKLRPAGKLPVVTAQELTFVPTNV
jgi:hypothetical protein